MEQVAWLWTTIWSLPWWLLLIFIAYTIYFVVRTWAFYHATKHRGVRKGYKEILFDYEEYFRLYHIFLIILDILPAVVGSFLPFLKAFFTFKIYKFKNEEVSK